MGSSGGVRWIGEGEAEFGETRCEEVHPNTQRGVQYNYISWENLEIRSKVPQREAGISLILT